MPARRIVAEHHIAAAERELAAAVRHAFTIQRRSVLAMTAASPGAGIAVGGSAQSTWDQQQWAGLVDAHVAPAVESTSSKLKRAALGSIPPAAAWGAGTDNGDAAAASLSGNLLAAGSTAGERIDAASLAGGKDVSDRLDGAEAIMIGLAGAAALAIANGSSVDALSQLNGATMTWNAIDDDRTREAHADADGQTVPVGSTFDVDGEDLAYPGDPAGSDENIINCRCWLTGDSSDLGG